MLTKILDKIREVKKAAAAAGGTLAMLIAQGAIPDPERGWAVGLLAILTALGVYTATNKPAS